MARTASLLARPFLIAAAVLGAASPAPAQLFWEGPDLTGPALTGAEPESGVNLPGATPEELRAGLLWNLRAALNVAALQCDFEPTLLTESNYNAMLAQHKVELTDAFAKVGGYFKRTAGAAQGQKLFDQYGTRTYSAYSTVQAQRNFCEVSGSVGRDAIFAPKAGLYLVAQNRLGEIRRALVAQSDRAFGNPAHGFVATLPPLDKKCWKRGTLTRKCAQAFEATTAR